MLKTLVQRGASLLCPLLAAALAVVSLQASAQSVSAPRFELKRLVRELVVTAPATGPTVGFDDPLTGAPPMSAVGMAALSTRALNFGSVGVGAARTLSVRLTNEGSAALALSQAPTLSGATAFGFASTGATTCGATLAVGAYCDTSVTFSPDAGAEFSGQLSFAVQGAQTETVTLSGSGMKQSGVLSANTSASFGNPTVNTTVTRSFTFRNTGSVPITGAVAQVSPMTGLSVSGSTCGTPAQPVSVGVGASCGITLSWTPTAASGLSGAQVSVTTDTSVSNAVDLSGASGSFDAAGGWSTSGGSNTAPTTANTTYAALTANTQYANKTFYLRNTGTHGVMRAAFQLSGDTAHFKIIGVTTVGWNGTGTGTAIGVHADMLSSVEAVPADVALNTYPHLAVTVQYAPKAVGSHRIALSATSSNGAQLPVPLVLTGSAAFDPTGVWSTSGSANSTPTATNQTYALQTAAVSTPGTTLNKTFYLRNIGTHGSLSSAFHLTGDTAQFKIVGVVTVGWNGTGTGTAQTVYAGGQSSAEALAQDVDLQGFPHLAVTVQYAPVAEGSHSVTLSATGTKGSALPAPLVLTGSALFDATGTWSSSGGANTALASGNTSYAALTANSQTATKTFYLRNTGTHGAMNTAFALSGDTSQFKIVGVSTVGYNGTGTGSAVTVYAGGQSSAPYTPNDVFGGLFPHMAVTVKFAPTAQGNFSVTLTPASTNGATMPQAITLTGTGK